MRNKMLRGILGLLFCSTITVEAFAQPAKQYIEPSGFSLGVNFGMTDMWGDVGANSIAQHYGNGKYLDKPCFMGGMFGKYTVHPAFAIRAGINYGTLYASDSWNPSTSNNPSTDGDYLKYQRNLDAKTNIWEGSLIFEITPLRASVESKIAHSRFQPYIFGGIAAIHFNAQGLYTNRTTGAERWVDLYNLHLEGDGLVINGVRLPKYSQFSYAIPVGLGVRWDIGYQLAIGIEASMRYAATDQLDGVSGVYLDKATYYANLPPNLAPVAADMYDKSWQINPNIKHPLGSARGNSNAHDFYSTFSVNFIYKINRRYDPWWK